MKRTTKHLKHFARAKEVSNTPMGAALADWLNSKAVELASSTMKGYCAKAKLIDKHFKNCELSEIKPRDVREFIAKLQKRGYSNKTVNEYLIVLRGVFKRLLEDDEIKQDPSRSLENFRTVQSSPDPFTLEEIDKIASVETDLLTEMALFQFGVHTGLRVSELLALAWEDIDLAKRTVRVQRARVNGKLKTPKTRRSHRQFKLSQRALDALESIKPVSYPDRLKRTYWVTLEDNRTDQRQRLRFVFLNSKTGGPIKTDSHYSRYFWEPLLREAGVRYRPPNNCRHTWASQMMTGGSSTAWIAAQLGHTSEQMIHRHYGRIIQEDLPDFVAQQEAVFAGLA